MADALRPATYRPRIIDTELTALAAGLPAIALEGARATGKTRTAGRRARSTFNLDDEATRTLIAADPLRFLTGPHPTLLDEWQHVPSMWDRVRRAVDDGAAPGSFLLTGSAPPREAPGHSGAGRIVSLRMRGLSLAERDIGRPVVSLAQLLEHGAAPIDGHVDATLADYTDEILRSGFPAIHSMTGAARRAQLLGYVQRLLDRDIPELGSVRRPQTLRRWLTAYAAATATTATHETIRRAAAGVDDSPPARSTTEVYQALLTKLFILDPLPGWQPSDNRLRRIALPAKHHLADPALAAALLGAGAEDLLQARALGPAIPRDGPLLGALFESLVTMSVRIYAAAAGAETHHLRTWSDRREIDLVVSRGRRVVALEVKLTQVPRGEDVKHLHWLKSQLGEDLRAAVVVTTGTDAYQRQDGILVVPAALLGP